MSRLFEARFPGRCDACGDRIEEGDEVGFVEDYEKPLCEPCWTLEGGEL